MRTMRLAARWTRGLLLRAAPSLERMIEVATTEISQFLAAEHAELEIGFEPAQISSSVNQTGSGNGQVQDE